MSNVNALIEAELEYEKVTVAQRGAPTALN
jgi:hypothetical protein